MSGNPMSKGEVTRSQILEIAYELFLKNGYAATSVRQIAQAAGLTVGGIYAHFENKEEIWADVFDRFHPYHEILPSLMAAEGETAEALFRDAAQRVVQDLEKREDIFNLMMIELVEFNGVHITRLVPRILPAFDQIGPKYLRFHRSLRSISPLSMARAFAGLFFSYYATEHFIPGPLRKLTNREKSLAEFVDIFLYGILADGDPARGEGG